ncbi:MAG: adenosine deaminase [Marinilabiliales bacterium]|nr:MAG: adenosine deaminase [Marinilabiliales bacterium]
MKAINLDIITMPKIELHVHIEGAVSPKIYYSLAEKNKIKLPYDSLEKWKDFFEFKDFSHFINVYGTAVSCIKTVEDISLIIEDFYYHQSKQNIIYSEAFISASFLIENFKIEEIIEAVHHAMIEGERKYNVKVNIIPDIARHLPESQKKVLALVKAGLESGTFIGLGLGGMEIGYPPHLFKDTFKKAKNIGLRLVAHAGEAVGAESIKNAIHELGVERIGHGIRCVDDELLMTFLKEKQIPLEISPTSNYHLGVINKKEKHPIRKMFDKGLLCTVNTDDPVMFSTTLSKEYDLLANQGFTIEELYELNTNAITSSFLDTQEKSDLYKILNEHKITYNIRS